VADVYNATVVQRVEIAPGLVIVRVTSDEPLFDFTAGQYTVLGLLPEAPRVMEADDEPEPLPSEKLIRRAYSIASSSKAGEFLEFYLTLVPSGALTPRLFSLKLNGRLHVGGKATGLFTLKKVPVDQHVVLVGTGTGLAPYMSMLREELVCGGERKFVVLHGARYSWDLGYRSELSALARHCPNMTYIPVVSRPQADPSWNGRGGYLQDVLLADAIEKDAGISLDPARCHVFLCGNPGMVDAAKEGLISRGFTPDHRKEIGTIHAEEYW
jgi:ferredoxin--NADP+ reductase